MPLFLDSLFKHALVGSLSLSLSEGEFVQIVTYHVHTPSNLLSSTKDLA